MARIILANQFKIAIPLCVLLAAGFVTYAVRCKIGNGYYTDTPLFGFFRDRIEYRCAYIK